MVFPGRLNLCRHRKLWSLKIFICIRYWFIWQIMRLSIEVAMVITLIYIKFLYMCTYCLSSHNMWMSTSVTSDAVQNVRCFMFLLLDDFNTAYHKKLISSTSEGWSDQCFLTVLVSACLKVDLFWWWRWWPPLWQVGFCEHLFNFLKVARSLYAYFWYTFIFDQWTCNFIWESRVWVHVYDVF
jgi:hypothetical protein